MRRSFALLAASLAAVAALAQIAPPPASPSQDPRAKFREMLCGPDMPPLSMQIPTIGCFGVATGSTARGTFDGHQFVVAVDAGGEPSCRLDGAAVDCSGCVGQHIPQCPVMLIVMSRN